MTNTRRNFCIECREECEYEIRKIKREYEIRDHLYEFEVSVAFCKNCGCEINIPGIMDVRAEEVDRQYREAENIISIRDIERLMDLYHIGKAPLSLALGFGEVTITRYLAGQVPSFEYSQIMQNALKSPEFMISKLNENREKIGDTAFKKAMKAAMELKDLFRISNPLLLTISYIFEKSKEVTPLALQKLLYFIQGFHLAKFGAPLYEEDCCAWVHGPVYESVYNLFREFKYNPIEDNRFALFKDRHKELAPEVCDLIDLVLDSFGNYSGKFLESITHKELPWQEAREGLLDSEYSHAVIGKDCIEKYYKDMNVRFDFNSLNGIEAYIHYCIHQ